MYSTNTVNFEGRLASAPTLTGADDRAVCKFVLISNQYSGKNENNEATVTPVSIRFTAFRGKAEAIAKNCMKGDQLIILAKIENNNWTDNDGKERYDYNFIVEAFSFGAPGEEKRKVLSSAA